MKESFKIKKDNRCVYPAPRENSWTIRVKENAQNAMSISLVNFQLVNFVHDVLLVLVRWNRKAVLVVHLAVLEHTAMGVKIVSKVNTATAVILLRSPADIVQPDTTTMTLVKALVCPVFL